MLNLWLIGEADGSHAGDQGGLAPPQQPHPDIKQPSPPGSDKPPTSARSGGQRSMSDRRQSATRRSGMEGYDTFWACLGNIYIFIYPYLSWNLDCLTWNYIFVALFYIFTIFLSFLFLFEFELFTERLNKRVMHIIYHTHHSLRNFQIIIGSILSQIEKLYLLHKV